MLDWLEELGGANWSSLVEQMDAIQNNAYEVDPARAFSAEHEIVRMGQTITVARSLLEDEKRDRQVEWIRELLTEKSNLTLATCQLMELGSFHPNGLSHLDLEESPDDCEIAWERCCDFMAAIGAMYVFWRDFPATSESAAAAAAERSVGHTAPRSQEPAPYDQELWTVEQLAAFEGVIPSTIRKRVSEYRSKHGDRDPIWVRRSPGIKRNFKIHWPSYQQRLQPRRGK